MATTPPHISIQLVHIQGPLKGEIQELDDHEVRIGRHPDCQLNFPKDMTTLSRVHARITREGNRFKLIDQSTNGTYVNGQRITETYLKDGDVIMFSEGGPKVSFLTQTGKKPPQASPRVTPPEAVAPGPRPGAATYGSPPPQPPAQPKPWSAPAASPRATFPSTAPPMPSAPPVQPARPAPALSAETVKVTFAIQYGASLKSFQTLPIVIGGGPGCDFAINHPGVEQRHAQIFFAGNQYWIKDLTGRNQITINNQPIPVQAALEPNSQLSLSHSGPKFRFIGGGRLAEIEDPAPEAPARSIQANDITPPQGQKPASKGNKAASFFKKFFP